jgi:hypothetical protein
MTFINLIWYRPNIYIPPRKVYTLTLYEIEMPICQPLLHFKAVYFHGDMRVVVMCIDFKGVSFDRPYVYLKLMLGPSFSQMVKAYYSILIGHLSSILGDTVWRRMHDAQHRLIAHSRRLIYGSIF